MTNPPGARGAAGAPITLNCGSKLHRSHLFLKAVWTEIDRKVLPSRRKCSCCALVEKQLSARAVELKEVNYGLVRYTGDAPASVYSGSWDAAKGYRFPSLTQTETTCGPHPASPGVAADRVRHPTCTGLPPLGVGAKRAREGNNAGICLCPKLVVTAEDLVVNSFVQVWVPPISSGGGSRSENAGFVSARVFFIFFSPSIFVFSPTVFFVCRIICRSKQLLVGTSSKFG